MSPERRRWAGALGLALVFFALGAYHIDRPGLQSDETLFVHGVWESGTVTQFTRVFGWRFPLMQMGYLGALKSILYQPIFGLFGVSAASVRLPMVLAGAVTVALTFLLMWRLSGERAAWIAGALLAVDPTFLFTTRCDWGPVAIERLLAVGGVLLFVHGRLNWGAFLFGLALWNKSTFLWTLIGLGAGMVVCYRPRLMRVRPAAFGVALLCFSAGAYPWIRYNVKSQGGTAKATARFDASDLNGKFFQLRSSLEGSALYGYMMRDGDARPWPRASFTPWLLLVAGVSAALARHRLALFFMTVTAAAWLAMALTYSAGGSAHHVVLLWPWPQCIIGLWAGSLGRRIKVVAVLCVLGSAAVVMRHYVLIDRYGSLTPWSEAIYPMTARIQAERPSGVFVGDWGMLEQIILFTRGTLPFEIGFHRADVPPERFAGRPGWIFVSYVDALEAFAGVNKQWKKVPGFQRIEIAVIKDRQGFPVYQLFKFVPVAVSTR